MNAIGFQAFAGAPARAAEHPDLCAHRRRAGGGRAAVLAEHLEGGALWLRWVALAVFIAAGVTDFFDGYFARIWGQQSSLGRMLDPIADKLLVASCLLMLAADGRIRGWSLLAAVIILCREILVSGLREYLAELRVGVPVTRLAKWKTIGQMVAVGFLIAGRAGDHVAAGGDADRHRAAVASAMLTLYTGWDYMRAGLRYDDRWNDRRKIMKLRYFAWVRERVGKPEEELELPAGDRHGRRADRAGCPRAARNMPMPSRTRR